MNYIAHLQEQIDKDIKIHRDEINRLEKLNSALTKYRWSNDSFKCMLGKSNFDALCPQCPIVLPRIQEFWDRDTGENQIKVYPTGMDEVYIEMCKNNEIGCIAWRQKQKTAACGCGGTAICICGYSEDFCYPPKLGCPYCGRELKITYSKNMLVLNNEFKLDSIFSPILHSNQRENNA